MTLSFIRFDKRVYTTMSIRPFSPCHPTEAMAGPIVSHIRIPYPAFSGGLHDLHVRLYPGKGCPHGGFPDCLDQLRMQAPHQCAGAQGGNIGSPTLGLSITGPPCYDRYRQYHSCSLYQQTGWDTFPRPVAAGSRFVSMATDSEYSHPGQTYSGLPWARHILGCLNVIADRLSRPNQPITTE